MRGSRDLPRPQSLVVGLPRPVIARQNCADEVGLGDDVHHRHTQIGPERGGIRRALLQRLQCGDTVERCRDAETRMDQEAVVDTRECVHRIDVRRQEHRRLRFPHRHKVFGLQPSEHLMRCLTNHSARLAEDVVRVSVTRMTETRIPFGVLLFQRHVDAGDGLPAVDTDFLRRDGDVRVARTGDLAMCHHPDCRCVDPTADVEPLDEDGSVELR